MLLFLIYFKTKNFLKYLLEIPLNYYTLKID